MLDDHYIQSLLTALGIVVPILIFFFKLHGAIDRLTKCMDRMESLIVQSAKELQDEIVEARKMASREHEQLLKFITEAHKEMLRDHKELTDRTLIMHEKMKLKNEDKT